MLVGLNFVGKQILALDGIGTLRQFTLDGQEYPTAQRDVRSFATIHDATLMILENQSVVRTDDQLNIVHPKVQLRIEIGERHRCSRISQGENWFVAREGHALVPGEEEALELEIYSNDPVHSSKGIEGTSESISF